MEIKEAIEILQSKRPFSQEQYCYAEKERTAYDMAISALKKQVWL